MNGSKGELVKSWLVKANRDLESAERLAKEHKGIWDTALDIASTHCLQAAENSMKGFLFFHDIGLEKPPGIEYMIHLAVRINKDFSIWLKAGPTLNFYGTLLARRISQEEFNEVLQLAKGIFSFVVSLLPDEVNPSFTKE